MIPILLLCVLTGAVLSMPLIRATRRAEAARAVIRPRDYLRTRHRSRVSTVAGNTFGVRS